MTSKSLCRLLLGSVATLLAPTLLASTARAGTVTQLKAGTSGSGVLLSPDQTTLYSTDYYGASIYRTDIATGVTSVVGVLNTGLDPKAVGLSLGPDGMFYGVGGSSSSKSSYFIFRMDPVSGKQKVLHEFSFNSLTKEGVVQGNLAFDSSGAIYGERQASVFKLDPSTGAFSTVHVFKDCSYLFNGLVFNPANGLFYGTSQKCPGQGSGDGSVFTIDPTNGAKQTVVYSGTEGVAGSPAGLVFDKTGQLFVETQNGKGAPSGSVFQIDPRTRAVTPIYTFSGGAEGSLPTGSIAFGPDGLLYGAMEHGGELPNGAMTDTGTLFKLDVTHGLNTVLYTFRHNTHLVNPFYKLAVNDQGKLFGAASIAIFEYAP